MSTKNFSIHKLFRFALVVAVTLAFWGPVSVSPALAQPTAVTFTVNTATDAHDSNLGDGTCHNGIDGCSLRAAIEQAFSVSSSGNPVIIHFWPDAGILYNLNLGYLNLAASYVTVDGESNGIIIDGSGLAVGQSIFTVSGSHNTLQNMTIRNAPSDGVQLGDFSGVGEGNYNVVDHAFLIGNGASGVFVAGGSGGGGQYNIIQYSYIGVSSSAISACVAGEGNGIDGVHIDAPAAHTTVDGNRIVCNGGFGVFVDGTGSSDMYVSILYNDIGLRTTAGMGNGSGGILDNYASYTFIHGNVISGNGGDGIWLNGDDNVTVSYNSIGTSAYGATVLPNNLCGIAITDSAHNNMIGGTGANDWNVVSGNILSGICIEAGAYDNTVEGNLIGVNGTGTAAIPNGLAGVAIFNANNNTIGTSAIGVEQLISGNTREGIWVANSTGTFIGQTNLIGVASGGITPLGNGLQGVMLDNASGTSVFPTIVAYNGGAGVAIVGDSAINNKVWFSQNYGNGGLAVDLGNDGHTANGSHGAIGPNNWLQYPVITSWNSTTIWGTTCVNCTVFLFRASGNPSQSGGGGDCVFPDIVADGYGNWSASLPAGLTRFDVTTMACASPCGMTSNTSEMSPLGKLYLPLLRK